MYTNTVACTALALLVSCTDDAPPLRGDAETDAAPDAARDAAAADADAGPCEGIYAEGISGRVLDTDGNPPELPQVVTFCGNACIYGEVAEDGTFRVEANFCYGGGPPLYRPLLIYHGLGRYADLNYDFLGPDHTGDAGWVHFDTPFRIPSIETMAVITVDGDTAQVLDDGAGFRLSMEPGAASPPFGREELGVVRLAEEHYPPVRGIETLTALWTTLPEDVLFDPPAQLELPNVADDPPGTTIEIVGIGNFATSTEGQPYAGTLGRVATATVSADGTTITLDEGEGIAHLTWLGYRRAP